MQHLRWILEEGEHPDRWRGFRWEQRQEHRQRGWDIQAASVCLQRRVCRKRWRKVGLEAEFQLLGGRWTWAVSGPHLGVT